MKKYITIATCWGLLLSLGACSRQGEEISPSGREIQITAAMETSGSRATALGFESGDQIGVFINQGSFTNLGAYTCTENPSDKWKPAGEPKCWLDETTPADFVAFYPYQSGVTHETYTFTVQADQSAAAQGTTPAGYTRSDLLYSDNVKKLSSVNVANLGFRHLMSKLVINIRGNATITSVNLSGTRLTANVSLKDGKITPGETSSGDITPLPLTYIPEGCSASYTAILIPQTLPEGTPLVKIVSDGKTYTYTLSPSVTLGIGEQRTLELSLSEEALHFSEIQAWEDNFDGDNLRAGIRTPIDLVDFAKAWNTQDETQLAKYGIKSNDSKWTFKLRADIDMTNVTTFEPIGNTTHPFTASFDGQGFTISHLAYKGDTPLAGFFGKTESGTISNLHLKDVAITNTRASGECQTGGMVALNTSARFSNCTVQGFVRGANTPSEASKTGGFCGNNAKDGSLTGCETETETLGGEASATYTGGLCGFNTGTLTQCSSEGKTQGGAASQAAYTGGLCAVNEGQINSSSTTGTVLGGPAPLSVTGGFCGGNNHELRNSHSKCDVTGANAESLCNTGGFIGMNLNKLENCSFSGSVQGGNTTADNAHTSTGGLCGDNSHPLQGCHAKGEVTGGRVFGYGSATLTGGLIGWQETNADGLTDCSSEGMTYGNNANGYDCHSTTGGLIGLNNNCPLDNCTSSATVLGGNSLQENGKTYTGGLIGKLKNSTDNLTPIKNCRTSGIVKGNLATGEPNSNTCESHTGGLIGQATKANVTDSRMTNAVYGQQATSRSTIGGLIGYSEGTTITTSYTTGVVSAAFSYTTNTYTGGLTGHNLQSTLTECFATGEVISKSNYTGGLTGYNEETSVTKCYATGNISGYNYVGGLIGNNLESTVTHCYTWSKIITSYVAAGLIGSTDLQSAISYCYASGEVSTGSTYYDGLIGNPSSSVTHCFWNNNTTNGYTFGTGCYAFDPKNGNVTINASETKTLLELLNAQSTPDIWEQKAGKLPTLK